MLPGFNYATFGDLDSVAKAIDGETCAVMFEPIQGEGGVNIPPRGFVEGVRELCDKHGLLMILDEVQTGPGPHREMVRVPALEHSARRRARWRRLARRAASRWARLVAKPEVAEKLKPGTHAATFGGNPVAARAALATIETIEQDGLLDRGRSNRRAASARRSRAEGEVPSDLGSAGEGRDDRRGTERRRHGGGAERAWRRPAD